MIKIRRKNLLSGLVNGLAIGSLIGYIWIIALLFMSSVGQMGGLTVLLDEITSWMNPIFVQYNLILLGFVIMLTPLITYSYILGMKQEKIERLHAELPDELWQKHQQRISDLIDRSFNLKNYLGSMSATTIVVMLGAAILLLLKPAPIDGSQPGIEYAQGANFLLLGPYMNLYVLGDPSYVTKLNNSILAFQFGFLGAFVHYLTHLVRSYFILDLTPGTFILSSMRMTSGAILALMVSFVIQDLNPVAGDTNVQQALPVISFFIGFFPSRGMNWIINFVGRVTGMVSTKDYFTNPISDLPGVNTGHELRLEREGFDNVQMLANADPVELSLRTGYAYGQLCTWIGQAKLAESLTCDYRQFVIHTGISETKELQAYIRAAGDQSLPLLDKATEHKISAKIEILITMMAND